MMKLETPKNQCKGITWRGSVTQFSDGEGRIKYSREIRVLKRKSCPGCVDCGWTFDLINDIITEDPTSLLIENIQHGKLYMIQTDVSQDWETGNWEVNDVNFVEVKDDQEPGQD